jgi:hypothetical protein
MRNDGTHNTAHDTAHTASNGTKTFVVRVEEKKRKKETRKRGKNVALSWRRQHRSRCDDDRPGNREKKKREREREREKKESEGKVTSRARV